MSGLNYNYFDDRPSFFLSACLNTKDTIVTKLLLDLGVIDKNSMRGSLNIAKENKNDNIAWIISQYLADKL